MLRTHKPLVGGSNPPPATSSFSTGSTTVSFLRPCTTVLSGGGTWTTTAIRPDDTRTVTTYTGGLMDSSENRDSGDNLITSTSIRDASNVPLSGYDCVNRPTYQRDSRTGVTITVYFSETTDVVASITDPGNRITRYGYDSRGRQILVTLPDTTTHTRYAPRGETQARWGSETYPEFHTYDYAGRPKTLRAEPDFTAGRRAAFATTSHGFEVGEAGKYHDTAD